MFSITKQSAEMRASSEFITEIRKTLRYCRPHGWTLAFALAAGCATMLCQIAIPWVLRLLIDDVLSGRTPGRLPLAVAALVAAAIGTVFFGFLHSYLFARLNGQIAIDVRGELAQHMKRISLNDAHARHSGDVTSIFVSDVPVFSKFFESVVGAVVINAFKLTMIFLILIFVSNRLTLITLVAILGLGALPWSKRRIALECGHFPLEWNLRGWFAISAHRFRRGIGGRKRGSSRRGIIRHKRRQKIPRLMCRSVVASHPLDVVSYLSQ